jgi:hypothetical protein
MKPIALRRQFTFNSSLQKIVATFASTALSRLLKKTHMLRCAQSSRINVLPMYASARRFFARLASEIFLSSLKSEIYSTC